MPHSHDELATWLVAFAKRHGEGQPWMSVTADELGLTRSAFRRLLSGKDQLTDDHPVIFDAVCILVRENSELNKLHAQIVGMEKIEVNLVAD